MEHPHPQRLRTLSVGGATYDLFLTLKEALQQHGQMMCLKVGGKIEVDRVIETCGGGACNTSVGLSRLGMDASFCGVIGSDQWGEQLLENLQREKVNVSSATVLEHETSSFSIVLSLPSGERTILYTAGVNEHLHDTTFDLEAMQHVDAVYLNHLCETSCMIQNDMIDAIIACPQITFAWNPGGCQIDAGMQENDAARLLRATDLLLLNREEAMTFTNAQDINEALKKLIGAGVANVCITDGARGTHASNGTHVYHCPVLQSVKVVDTTGAGDAFGIAALWALLRGHPLQTMMISGTLNSASVVGAIGAQAGLLREHQITERLDEHLLEVSTVT